MLPARRERPRGCRASNHFDEVAPSHTAPSGAQDHANPIQSAAVAPSQCGVLLVICWLLRKSGSYTRVGRQDLPHWVRPVNLQLHPA
jgi:hypothetical protein